MRLKICLIVCCFGIHLVNSIAIKNVNDVDCNPNDLEKMSIEDQIKVAVKSDHCRKLAHSAFKKKWESPIIVIDEGKTGVFETFFGNVTVISSGLAENFLKVFGSKYDNLWVDCHQMEWNKCKEIGGHLHKYCAESLKTLLFIYLKPGVFKDSQPFKNLQNLTIFGMNYAWDDISIDPTVVFPNLSILHIEDYYEEGSFDRVYPHLIDFSAYHFNGGYSNFFQKNPQIRKLGSYEGGIDYLAAVRDSYPQLEEFSFRVPYKFNETYHGPPFVFENMKRVKIHSDSTHGFNGEKFIFKPLEYLEIHNGGNKVTDEWFTFIESNKNLNQINTYTQGDGPTAYFDGPGVFRLSKAANFISVDIFCDNAVGAEEILTFVKNNQNLKEFNVFFMTENEDLKPILDQVRKELEKEWKSLRILSHLKYQSIAMVK